MTVSDFGERWEGACGHNKGKVIAEMCEHFGWSKQTCYRKLSAAGFESGKRRRRDAGKSSLDAGAIEMIAAMNQAGLRKNGKATMHTPTAKSIAMTNGIEVDVSNRQINRLLQDRQINAQSLRTSKPHTKMRSLHPNHVWQIDPSLCLMYYSPQKRQTIIEDHKIHKNKPEFIEKMKSVRLWRYACTDHFSGYTYVYYYQQDGENQQTNWDFFLRCAMQKKDTPFHGVPKIILWDKGSANISRAMTSALEALGVQALTHKEGAPQAKGSVENGNRRTEMAFESRLLYEPLQSVAELNRIAEAFFIAYNANYIPHYESKMKREGRLFVREQLWLQIKENELRILPDISLCRRLLANPFEERIVDDGRCISLRRHSFTGEGGLYHLGQIEVLAGQRVQVQCLAFAGQAIAVRYKDFAGQMQSVQIDKPLPVEEHSGFIATAAVIGEEFRGAADDEAEQNRKHLQKAAYPNGKKSRAVPFQYMNDGAGLTAHSHLPEVLKEHNEKLLRLPLRGVPVALGYAQIFEAEYSLPEALTKLKSQLEDNKYEYSKTYVELVRAQMRGGKITEAKLEGIFQCITEENSEYSKHA